MRYDLRVVMGIIQFAMQRFDSTDIYCFRVDYDVNMRSDFISMLQGVLADDNLVKFTPTEIIDTEQYTQFNAIVDSTIHFLNQKARLLGNTGFIPNIWTKLAKTVMAEGNFIDAALEPEQAELIYSLKKIQSKWLKRFDASDLERLSEHKLNANEKHAAIMQWYAFLGKVMLKRPAVVQILHTFFHMVRVAIETQPELEAETISNIVAGPVREGLGLNLSGKFSEDPYFFKELVIVILKSTRIGYEFNPGYYNLISKPSRFKWSKGKSQKEKDREQHSESESEAELEATVSISPRFSPKEERKAEVKRALSQSDLLKDSGHHRAFLSSKKQQQKQEKQLDALAEDLTKLLLVDKREEESEGALPKLSSVLRFTPSEDKGLEKNKKEKGASRRQVKLKTSN